MSDTPETDNFIVSAGYVRTDHQWRTFARKLERERNEARAELEMWRDGNILHEIHRDELEKVERERDEVREALRDMLSGWKYIRSVHGDLYGVGWDRAQSKAETALETTK